MGTYAYDQLGNRTNVNHNGNNAAYTPNDLNQYTQRVVPGYFDVAGVAAGSTVSVSRTGGATNSATKHGLYFFDAYALPNSSAPIFDFLDITDNSVPPETGEVAAYLPETPEAFTYDEDGNLTRDGRWVYVYDAENRLVTMFTRGAPEDPDASVSANEAVWDSGILQQKLLFTYDYMGRRVQKISYVWDDDEWDDEPIAIKYVYNGWNLIATLDATSLAVDATYTWGLDLSGTMQGAGGVGGLLMIQDGSDTFLPAYDAMGNVHALMTAASTTIGGNSYSAGDIVAAYEYDAFGQTLRESGPYAADNPFRFSTKYTDNETGLVYYGHRYYSPSLGRFINRDPIEEQGGINLYSFVGNNAVNAWDYLGMDAFMTTTMGADGTIWWHEGDGMDMQDMHNQSVAAATSMAIGMHAELAAADVIAYMDAKESKDATAKLQKVLERVKNGETVKVQDANGNVHELGPDSSFTVKYGDMAVNFSFGDPNSSDIRASGAKTLGNSAQARTTIAVATKSGKTADAAALNAASYILGAVINTGNEWTSRIGELPDGSFVSPYMATDHLEGYVRVIRDGPGNLAGHIHGHFDNPNFSETDILASRALGVPDYMVYRDGTVQKYDPGISIFGWHPFESTKTIGTVEPNYNPNK